MRNDGISPCPLTFYFVSINMFFNFDQQMHLIEFLLQGTQSQINLNVMAAKRLKIEIT